MEPGYEKRLLGSPYSSPIKPMGSPGLTTPTKENCYDRFIPVRNNAKWKLNGAGFDSPRSPTDASRSAGAPTPNHAYHQQQQTPASVTHTTAALPGTTTITSPSGSKKGGRDANPEGRNFDMLSALVSNELLAAENRVPAESPAELHSVLAPRENRNMFSYKICKESPGKLKTAPYSLSPVSEKSQRLLKNPKKQVRKIPKVPYKVLDAPDLQDDFYLNLVDWSSQNVLSVGLGTCVYLWSAYTSQVTRLCDVSPETDNITSVSWSEKGNHVAVGTYRGLVQLWDVVASKRVRLLEGHSARVGALAWNGDLLASGSRDRSIRLRDTRAPPTSVLNGTEGSQNSAAGSSNGSAVSVTVAGERILKEHKQEVCGLKWSPDHQYLASGGNDNRLLVWSQQASLTSPVLTYEDHVAAVKAIAWSPHQHGLLASGGGTADRCIKFWNTLTGQALQSVDTGSQVCNIAWSMHSNEIVSTHGYSQNQVLVWKYPSMQQLAKLTGHSYRVLYLAMSPDGESIVTGAGDETLRFWNIFQKAKVVKPVRSALNLFDGIR